MKFSRLRIPLPSEGLFYKGFLNNKKYVYVKILTPQEEDLLLNPTLQKDNECFYKIIESCIENLDISPESFLSCDLDAIFLSLRINAYGIEQEMKDYPCNFCNFSQAWKINLGGRSVIFPDKLKQLALENKNDGNLFNYEGLELQWKIRDGVLGEEEYKQEITKEGFLAKRVVSVKGNIDKEVIQRYLKKMPARLATQLYNHIRELEPRVDLEFEFTCANCQKKYPFTIPSAATMLKLLPQYRESVFLESFFAFGYYFGMGIREYMNFPLEYRSWLMNRIEKEIKAAHETQNAIPDKTPQHNSPQIRSILGMSKTHTPNARSQRF